MFLVISINVCLMSPCISPISYLPASVFFCQYLLLGTCWCLFGLNSRVFLSSIFLESSIDVCLKCFPTSFAKSVWRDHLMSFWINPMSFLPVSVWWFWSVSVRAGSHLSLSANVCYEEPADVYLDWTRVSSCQYLSSELNRCLLEVCPTACLSVSF